MEEQIFELARVLGGVDTDGEGTLRLLVRAAQAELAGKLREGVTPRDCESAFLTAAAWLALAGWLTGQSTAGETASSFTAGSLSIDTGGDETALARGETLRRRAEELLRPYCRDESFAFQGVRG